MGEVRGGRRRRFRCDSGLGLAGAALTAAFLAAPVSAVAQTVRVEQEQPCRCVDRNGNEIENCTCFRTPRVEILRGALAGGLFQRRSQIGVWIDAAQEEVVDRQGGVLVTDVREGGPAAEAGLETGDIVLRVDGRSLADPLPEAEEEASLDPDESLPVQRFVRLVGALEPGEPVAFELVRDGEPTTVTVTPEEAGAFGMRAGEGPLLFLEGDAMHMELQKLREGESRLREELEGLRWREGEPGARVWAFRAPPAPGAPGDSLRGRAAFTFFGGDPCFALEGREGPGFAILAAGGNCVDGVEFLELNPDLAEYFEAPQGGVLVTEVSEESTLGLRAGDVLVAIDGRDVRDAGHVRRIISSYEHDEEIRLRIIRKGSEMEVLGRRRDG